MPKPKGMCFERVKSSLGPLRAPLDVINRRLYQIVSGGRRELPKSDIPDTPSSDGFYERLGAKVLHVTYPLHFIKTAVPTLFSIYDLQHCHYPEFFQRAI